MTQSSYRLSLERVEYAARTIDPVFLHSSQFICEPLSDELGVQVALKILKFPFKLFTTEKGLQKQAVGERRGSL